MTDPDFLPWLDRHTSRREPLSLENLVAELQRDVVALIAKAAYGRQRKGLRVTGK